MARQGMSYRRMAETISRPHNTVSHWLNGESAIDPDVLESMCNALGMETPDLYAAARRNGGWTIQMPPVRPRPSRVAVAATPEVHKQPTHEYSRPGHAPIAAMLDPEINGHRFRFENNLVAGVPAEVA